MQPIITNWQPLNSITTPLTGIPTFTNSGIIKAIMKSGEKISVAQIDYQEFDEENFQYVITPYWEIIDGLPSSIFQGIPGIDMDLRLNKYYRVNYIPTFIAERTPAKNREDLWDLLGEVGLDYYDRFEWLLRTNMKAANDNLVVERRRMESITSYYDSGVIDTLQYGDTVIVDSLEDIADTVISYSDFLFSVVTRGINVISKNSAVLIDATTRSTMTLITVVQRMIQNKEYTVRQQKGIEQAKKDGKYKGRKPIKVDMNVLREVAMELEEGLVSVKEAMQRVKISSKSTFYRKLKELEV